MPKPDGPQFKLFHGTNAELNEGDLITPAHSRVAAFLPEHLRVSFATDNPTHAKYFGKNVYEVTPVDPEDVWGPQKMDQYDNEPNMVEFTSRKGFRVIK